MTPDAREIPDRILEMDDGVFQILFHVERSIAYHDMRARFFGTWRKIASTAGLLALCAMFLPLAASLASDEFDLTGVSVWMIAAGFTLMLSVSLPRVYRVKELECRHTGLKTDFIEIKSGLRIIEARDARDEKDALTKIWSEIHDVEMREPPIKRYLDVMARNRISVSMGLEPDRRLKPWQVVFAQYMNGDTALQ